MLGCGVGERPKNETLLAIVFQLREGRGEVSVVKYHIRSIFEVHIRNASIGCVYAMRIHRCWATWPFRGHEDLCAMILVDIIHNYYVFLPNKKQITHYIREDARSIQ